MVAALHGAEPEKDVSMVEERQVGAGDNSATHHWHTPVHSIKESWPQLQRLGFSDAQRLTGFFL
jgi:hypothetical protein